MKKAVILAGGKGIRLFPSTEDIPKPMLKVNGKPILEYNVRLLKSLGFVEIYMVVGYKQELIRDYFLDGKGFGININYIDNAFIDNRRKSGLSDAVLLVDGIINEQFLTILGDEIYLKTKHREMVESFEKSNNCECMLAVFETDNLQAIKKNYSVKVNEDLSVTGLEEKPENPVNNLLGCGTYIFKPSVFDYIKKTKCSPKSGRKELADTINEMVVDGKIVKVFPLGGNYININYPQDINAAEKYLGEIEGK